MNKISQTDLGSVQQIVVEKMHLLYMEVPSDIESQKKAWTNFEAHFPSLTGRKMFGLDYDDKKLYQVCSLVLESDHGETFGLKQFEFEGGSYLRLRLKFDSPELFEKIGPAYQLLISQYEKQINWSRPLIEYYKAKNILDLMIPVDEG